MKAIILAMEKRAAPIPELAPPGAGIPAIERLVGGLIFAVKRLVGSRERFASDFDRERAEIRSMYLGLDERMLSERVLIARLRGLEDSSRHWSVWMTLDHLRIVNDEITRVIGSLASQQVPSGAVSTAAVKPDPNVDGAVLTAYEASCDRLSACVASCMNLRTAIRFAHPWFGPLDAAGWHAMAAMHLGIHRNQISRILADTRSRQS